MIFAYFLHNFKCFHTVDVFAALVLPSIWLSHVIVQYNLFCLFRLSRKTERAFFLFSDQFSFGLPNIRCIPIIYAQTSCNTPKTKENLKSHHMTLLNSIQWLLKLHYLLYKLFPPTAHYSSSFIQNTSHYGKWTVQLSRMKKSLSFIERFKSYTQDNCEISWIGANFMSPRLQNNPAAASSRHHNTRPQKAQASWGL